MLRGLRACADWAGLSTPSCALAAIASGKPMIGLGSLLSAAPIAVAKLIPPPQVPPQSRIAGND